MCATNLYGYYKCRGCKINVKIEHNKKLNELKAQGIATIAGRLFKVLLLIFQVSKMSKTSMNITIYSL